MFSCSFVKSDYYLLIEVRQIEGLGMEGTFFDAFQLALVK